MERCNACLSLNRKLIPIKEFQSIFRCLLDNTKFVGSHLQEFCLSVFCWECYQKLKNIKKFQYNINQAQELLEKYHKRSIEKKDLISLSSLSTHIKSHYDYTYTENDIYNSGSLLPKSTDNTVPSFTISNVKQEIDTYNQTDLSSDVESKTDMILYEIGLSTFDTFEAYEDEKGQESSEHVSVKKESKQLYETEKGKKRKKHHKNRKYKVLNLSKEDCMRQCVCVSLDETGMLEYREKQLQNLNRSSYKYKCENCVCGFHNKWAYNTHMKTRHDKIAGEFVCSVCNVRVKTDNKLQVHMRSHYAKYSCAQCSREFHKAAQFRRHFEKTHVTIVQCSECPLTFENKPDVYKHHREMHTSVFCDYCNRKFNTKSSLIKHIGKKHTLNKCDVCNKVYKESYSLSRHKRKHHTVTPGEDTYCVECDIRFDNELLYSDHVKYSQRHGGKRMVPCPECGKVYAKQWNMMRHYDYVHTEKTRFFCEPCNRYFLNGFRLRTHISTFHNKLQPPKNKICQYCSRGFSTNRILANHILTHTGERPHACAQCPARFAQAIALKSHVNTQHVRPAERLFLQIK